MTARCLAWAAVGLLIGSVTAEAQETVRVTVPSTATFNVTNVTMTTEALPVRVSFDTLIVLPGRGLRVSVKADSANFTRPVASGLSIPATKVSWTASNASGGTGAGGSLNSSSYTTMFEGTAGQLWGGVDLAWKLAAPGGGIRSGSHSLVVRYKLEAH